MAQQTEMGQPATPQLAGDSLIEHSTADRLSVQHSTDGLTVVHSAAQPARANNDGLQVMIRPGMAYTVEADPPSTARAGRHRRPAPIKPARAHHPRELLATFAGVALIFGGIVLIAWTMAHQ